MGRLKVRCGNDWVQWMYRNYPGDNGSTVASLGGRFCYRVVRAGASLLDSLRKFSVDPAFAVDFQSCVRYYNTVRVNQIVTIFLIESSIHILDHNRYPVDTSLIQLESRKSPTAELFDVDS
nr:hypothetical protein [Tanacetum cinerariifolium]